MIEEKIKISESEKLRLPDISIDVKDGKVIRMNADAYIPLSKEYHFAGINSNHETVYFGRMRVEQIFNFVKNNPKINKIAGCHFQERVI